MSTGVDSILACATDGQTIADGEAHALREHAPLDALLEAARGRRDRARANLVTYSPKVFVPLTKLCRDVCRYCTFAHPPRAGEPAFLSIEESIAIARAGAAAGCHEALFTLGDRPELRWRAAREALDVLGHASTLDYLVEVARRVHEETGLLPHLNPGVMSGAEIARLRPVSASMGTMLESSSPRLCERGGPHHGCPDKDPRVRLATIAAAGEAAVPFTTGILVGIGETERDRVDSLLAIRDLHARHGHVQEVIVQNFRAKPGTAMAGAPEPELVEHLRAIALARLVLDPAVTVQAPPNLSAGSLGHLLRAGIDDWGGVSPVTPDHVNPEAPWPHLAVLRRATEAAGLELVPRLPVHPRYALEPDRWLARRMRPSVLARRDADGFAREDDWTAGARIPIPVVRPLSEACAGSELRAVLERAARGRALGEEAVARLLAARGREAAAVCERADRIRREVNGDTVTYVVNRNVNYTNVCYFGCRFCAFSKGKLARRMRGAPYDLDLDEIERRTREAWDRGATEICLQGGIHPDYTGETYLAICGAVKRAAPAIHVHAFSPLEVSHGARTLGISLGEFLAELRREGLGTLPGTAAEILDDEVRAVLCPDKIDTAQWLEVMERAHAAGLRTTATIMFGHVDRHVHQARHLLQVRALQERTGGFTEMVPLPFVHMEAPLFRAGRARRGPTFREAVLMHAVARLVLHPHLGNVQVSWVKMGPDGARACLDAGANDLGGTLMNESITRAAGAAFGEEVAPAAMERIVGAAGRTARQRTTLYGEVPSERIEASFRAAPLAATVEPPAPRVQRRERPMRFGTG